MNIKEPSTLVKLSLYFAKIPISHSGNIFFGRFSNSLITRPQNTLLIYFTDEKIKQSIIN